MSGTPGWKVGNTITIEGDTALIHVPRRNGTMDYIMIDAEDVERVQEYTWGIETACRSRKCPSLPTVTATWWAHWGLDPTGTRLNPQYVEYLMGIPIGRTELDPSETRRFRSKLRKRFGS